MIHTLVSTLLLWKFTIAYVDPRAYCAFFAQNAVILINLTPYHDRDMPDKNLHSSVGGMTGDKVRVSSAGHDRQLEDPERTMAIYLCDDDRVHR